MINRILRNFYEQNSKNQSIMIDLNNLKLWLFLGIGDLLRNSVVGGELNKADSEMQTTISSHLRYERKY